jgi:hypothetical protein
MNGIFFITKIGSILGREDKTRRLALPLYKRLFAKINRRYRMRYIDIKPMIGEVGI